ncbi:MAG TPA: hypothetical protein VHH34_12155 [Pseudonocardiaceae bacterium]|nr:hypothetical protein [Pseudonocardiaceae bacterium]
MKHGGRVMLAVAGGYFLGRTKKMKLAIMLAGVASGNKIARDPTQLLAQGARLVQSNPQFAALGDQVRDRLVEAGKGVAVAVVSRQMDSLSERLSERTGRLSGRLHEDDPAEDPTDEGPDDAGAPGPVAPSPAAPTAAAPVPGATGPGADGPGAAVRGSAEGPGPRRSHVSTAAGSSRRSAPSATRPRSSGRSQGGGRDA